jgi:Tfp pilus assembly protein PilF
VGNEDADYDCPMEEIRLERGVAYYNLDSLNRAFHDIQFCIERQFNLKLSYRFRGLIYAAAGKMENSCIDFQNAIQLGDTESIARMKQYCK